MKRRKKRRTRKNLALLCVQRKIRKAGLQEQQVRWWIGDESHFDNDSDLHTARIMALRLQGQALDKIAQHYGVTKAAIHHRERRFFALSRFRILTAWRRHLKETA